MAKQTLPVDFKDDVLNVSMDGKRRYRLLLQEGGTYVLEDVTDYDTVGSTFGAAQINATNQAVNQSVDKDDVLNTSEEVEANTDEKKVTGALVAKQLISELSANGNKFYFDYQNGKYGYNTDPERGADTFRPFSGSDFQIILTLGTGMTDAELISIRKNGIEFILDKIPYLNQNAPYGYIQVVYANRQWTIRNISGAVLTLKDLNDSTQTEFAQNEEKTWSYAEEKFFVLTE